MRRTYVDVCSKTFVYSAVDLQTKTFAKCVVFPVDMCLATGTNGDLDSVSLRTRVVFGVGYCGLTSLCGWSVRLPCEVLTPISMVALSAAILQRTNVHQDVGTYVIYVVRAKTHRT